MASFFKYGAVEVIQTDDVKRQVAIHVCVPNCVMQPCLPLLLGFGLMDGIGVRNPAAAWVPIPAADMYKTEVVQQSPHAPDAIGRALEAKVEEVLNLYAELTKLIENPMIVVPLLPMGTYVTFRYRCDVDDIAKILVGLQVIPTPGVSEFQYAMAQELASILRKSGDVIVGASK